jgi:hypothetical protein
MAEWHDVESVRDQWVDAPLDDELLDELLENAKGQVIAYAFKSVREAYEAATEEEPFDVPANLRLAQRRQTENLWTAGNVDSGGAMGEDTFVRTPHPLDWHVKQIIRPRSAVPRVR